MFKIRKINGVHVPVCTLLGEQLGLYMTGLLWGGCFKKGTQVMTPMGDRNIEDLREGDAVFCYDAAGECYIRNVTKTHKGETGIMMEITLWDGKVLNVTPGHWLYNDRDTFTKAAELDEQSSLINRFGDLVPIHLIQTTTFDDPIECYNIEVEEFKTFYAESFKVHNGSAGKGGGSSQQDTSMSRTGNTNVRANTAVPPFVRNRMDGYMSNILNGNDTTVSKNNQLLSQSNSIAGIPNMKNASNIDITSAQYINDTEAAFDDRLSRALATARTGEANVLAPVARGQSFREADAIQQQLNSRQIEVESQKMMDFSKMLQSGSTLIDTAQKGVDSQIQNKAGSIMPLEALGKLLGDYVSNTSEQISGRGAQTASGQSWGMQTGMSCCFIFLEAYNGKLPKHVRECRDEFAPDSSERRRGYIWMSRWLVPMMRNSKIVRWFVNRLMVQPLEKFGGWYKFVDGYDNGHRYLPVVVFWFNLWERIGKCLAAY